MKALLLVLMMTAVSVSALWRLPHASAAEADRVLHIYTWADYFDPATVRMFEEKHGCRVEFDYYDSNDTMYSVLSDSGGYDVMTPASNTAASLFEKGVLLRLDHSLLPNLAFLDADTPGLLQDPEMLYSVPYTITVTGVGYNRKLVPADAAGGWDVFGRSDLAGRMTMLNDMRETLGAGLKFLGYDINSVNPEEVREAGRLILGWKRNLAMFDVDQARAGLRDGTYAAVQTYNGDVAALISRNPDIGFLVPKEGSALNSDDFVVAIDTEVPDLAHAFINHYLDPEVAALNMASIYYFMPNPAALKKLPPELRDNPAFAITDDVIARCEMIRNLGGAREHYDEAWEKVLLEE